MDLDSPPAFELSPSQSPPSIAPMVNYAVARPQLLATLPDEIILAVLGLLDVPELYALTKVSFCGSSCLSLVTARFLVGVYLMGGLRSIT